MALSTCKNCLIQTTAFYIFCAPAKQQCSNEACVRVLTLSPAGSSSVAAWMAQARKQRMAPIHSRMENPPKSCRQNLTHSGVVGGGVRALGPSRARYSAALALVRPFRGQESVRRNQEFTSNTAALPLGGDGGPVRRFVEITVPALKKQCFRQAH